MLMISQNLSVQRKLSREVRIGLSRNSPDLRLKGEMIFLSSLPTLSAHPLFRGNLLLRLFIFSNHLKLIALYFPFLYVPICASISVRPDHSDQLPGRPEPNLLGFQLI